MTRALVYLPWIIGFGLLMENIDISIINTAIPKMALALHSHPITMKIAVTSYLLTLAAFIPISGYIADRYGTKPTFSWAIVGFLIGSILCGLAHSVFSLVLGRLVQGVGGAMMTPVGRLILLRSFSKQHFVKAFSSLSLLGQIGPALGPLAGGFLTSFGSWRLVFLVNLPFGILALLLVQIFVQNNRQEKLPAFDFIGFILFGLGIACVTFAFSLLAEAVPHHLIAWNLLIVGAVLLLVFYRYSRHKVDPSLDLKLLQVRTFRIATFGGLVVRMGLGGIVFLLPLLYQVSWGFSPFMAGLLICPYGLTMALAKPWVKPLLKRYGFRRLLMLNPILIALLLCSLGGAVYLHSWILMACLNAIAGFFSSLQFTFMNILNFVDIDETNSAKATSMASVFQQLSNSFGVCMVAFLLILFNTIVIKGQLLNTASFGYTLLALAVIILLSLFIFNQLLPKDGNKMLHQ